MRARAKRTPGQPGTKALVELYGDRLICVRYRYDIEKRRRYKTIELIIDEGPWSPPAPPVPPNATVYLRLLWGEEDVAKRLRLAGGKWNAQKGLWEIRYAMAIELNMADRIVEPPE